MEKLAAAKLPKRTRDSSEASQEEIVRHARPNGRKRRWRSENPRKRRRRSENSAPHYKRMKNFAAAKFPKATGGPKRTRDSSEASQDNNTTPRAILRGKTAALKAKFGATRQEE